MNDADWAEFRDRMRFDLLRASRCTGVQLDRLQQRRSDEIYRRWQILKRERKELESDKRIWYGAAPKPLNPTRPFCFNLYRMKRVWRDADRRNDLRGRPVDRTVGATEARAKWSEILAQAGRGQLIRIRHSHRAEPAILLDERTYREMEAKAGS